MAFEACVQQILCSLSESALNDTQNLIDGQITLLQTQIAAYQTQLLQYDLIAPLIIASRNAAQTIVDQGKDVARFIPLRLIEDCADLGNLTEDIQASIGNALYTADDLAFEATRLLSYREELNAIVNELNAAIEELTDFRVLIDECLAGV
jgi:hypothetical protein